MNPTAPVQKKRRLSVGSIAALLIASSLAGQVLGFFRTKLVGSNFPATGPHSTDAYFAAFAVPDFFFFTLAAGALGVAFIPILSEHLTKNDRKGAWELSASLMNFLAILMFFVGLIILVFAPQLIRYVVAPNLGPVQQHNAVIIMRFLAFNPLLFTVSGVFTSVQQTMGRFFFYAIAPLFYNLSIIISIFVFRHNVGLVGLGLGAFIGAVLQLIIVAVGTTGLNFHWRPKIKWQDADFRTVLRNLPPRSLGQGIDQVESVIETHIASTLGTGSITFFNYAYTLSVAPILLVGSAISTAAFPRLTHRLSQGRPDLFRQDFLKTLRAMIWISAPLVIVCFFGRGYLTHMIYSRGSIQISNIFGFLTMAIFFRILYAIISRWFYAQKDTKTPLYVSLFIICLNIVLAYTLARPSKYGVSGLALAQSIVSFVEVLILSIIMVIRDHKLFDADFWDGVWRITAVSGFSVLGGFVMVSLFPMGLYDTGVFTIGGKFLLIAGGTFAVHFVMSALFGLEEVGPVLDRVRQFVFKPIKIDV